MWERSWIGLACAAVGSFGLASCNASADQPASMPHGRYLGIGVFSAGQLWSKIVVRGAAADASSATTADDEHVIVVVDSQTGEVRECGDYSGVCASLNPWTKAVAPEHLMPVKLSKHAAELAAEQRASASGGNPTR